MRWLAARIMIAAEDIKRFGGMSVHEMRNALRVIPGAENLTISYAANGNQLLTIAGKTVEVRPDATNAEIVIAFSKPQIRTIAVPPSPTGKKPMSITGAGAAGLSLKAMLEKQKALIQSGLKDNMAKIQSGFDKQNEAVAAVGTLGDKVHAEADDLLASVGQFTNDLGGSGT